MSDNTTGQPGGSGQDDASRYPAGQQWQQPTASGQEAPANPPAHQSYGQQQPGYGQTQGSSPYGAQGGYGGGYGQQPTENPGKTLGIVGFILSLIPFITIAGLIVSIIAFVKSRKAGMGNGFALAGIIIGALGVIGSILFIILTAVGIAAIGEVCNDLGSGTHTYQGTEITCP